MGTSILYQGPYKPTPGQYYADYSVMVPSTFPAGTASLGVINLFMVGVSGRDDFFDLGDEADSLVVGE